ncbi:unnamed protein product [Pylaiella littoralis]
MGRSSEDAAAAGATVGTAKSSKECSEIGLSNAGGYRKEPAASTCRGRIGSSRSGWYTAVALVLLVAAAAVLIFPAVDRKIRTTAIDIYEREDDHFWGMSPRRTGLQARSGTDVRHQRGAQEVPSAEAVGAHQAADLGQPPSKDDDADEVDQWKGAGGQFGLRSDWRLAIQEGGDLRGEACMAEDKREEVREILEKRIATPDRKKVAVCLRTKDYARFLPEWIAFHYAIGVDEISLYDDDSADNTTEVIKPFVDAGIVRYFLDVISSRRNEMGPLNRCLKRYMEENKSGDRNAPSWLLFHDTDEYIYPEDTSLIILQALEKYNGTCCAQVPRVQYGTSGYQEMPGGLLQEVFLAHESRDSRHALPKVMVNLDPTDKDHPVLPNLHSMHSATGCKCVDQRFSNMRINHYLGCRGDYVDRLSRYWTEVLQGNMSPDHRLEQRDKNDCRSFAITHWACATREILYKAEKGLDLQTGLQRTDPRD